jgi:hypothetical protein
MMTNLIFLFFQLYFLPVVAFKHATNSFIIVGLLLVLLQVTWPTFMMDGKLGEQHVDSIGCTLCSIPTHVMILKRA